MKIIRVSRGVSFAEVMTSKFVRAFLLIIALIALGAIVLVFTDFYAMASFVSDLK